MQMTAEVVCRQPFGTNSTATPARRATPSATLPRTARARPLRPCDAITMTFALICRAVSRIASTGGCSTTRPVAVMPAAFAASMLRSMTRCAASIAAACSFTASNTTAAASLKNALGSTAHTKCTSACAVMCDADEFVTRTVAGTEFCHAAIEPKVHIEFQAGPPTKQHGQRQCAHFDRRP